MPTVFENAIRDWPDAAEVQYVPMGVPQYWIVDPDVGEIIIRINENGHWRTTARLSAETPAIDVAVNDLGMATLRRQDIFKHLAQ